LFAVIVAIIAADMCQIIVLCQIVEASWVLTVQQSTR